MIPPGTKITCPKCALHIATSLVFIEFDEDKEIYMDDFDWHVPLTGSSRCHKCDTQWGDRGGWLHTEFGWEEI